MGTNANAKFKSVKNRLLFFVKKKNRQVKLRHILQIVSITIRKYFFYKYKFILQIYDYT